MEEIKSCSGSLTDWLMVGITLVYVVTTIAIWLANRKSARATEKQLIESRRQFAENQRLQMLPSLQIDVDEVSYDSKYKQELEFTLFSNEQIFNCRQSVFSLSLENAGIGTAKNLIYYWVNAEGEETQGCFPISVLCQQKSVKYIISVGITSSHAVVGEKLNAKLIISFKDLLNNRYKQSIALRFEVREDGYAILKESQIEKLELVS